MVSSGTFTPLFQRDIVYILLISILNQYLIFKFSSSGCPIFVCLGCRGAIVVAEARSADEPVLTRRCVIMKVQDFTTENYLQTQRQNAAAVLILLPKNISSVPFDAIKVTSHPGTLHL